MPVRDALHALHAEGLVTLDPRHGARVGGIDLKRTRHIYQIREVIEGWAIEESVPRMERRHLQKIQRFGDRLQAAMEVEDTSEWLEIDRQFHLSTYEPLENPELMQIVTELWNATQQLRRSYCMLPGALAKAYEFHSQLLDAINQGDAKRAGELERAHIRETLRSVAAHLEPAKDETG
jgi:DNA-binding GntR family transcriptional regulator